MIDPYILILDRWLLARYAMDYRDRCPDDSENAALCEAILNLVREDGHKVAIDDQYMIPVDEWDEFRDVPLLRQWIKYALNGNVEFFERTELSEPIDDPDDQHYAEIAMESPPNIMMSGDQPLKEDINSRKDIDLGVWLPAEGSGLLTWYRSQGYARTAE